MVVYNRTIVSRQVLGERVVCEEEREEENNTTHDARSRGLMAAEKVSMTAA